MSKIAKEKTKVTFLRDRIEVINLIEQRHPAQVVNRGPIFPFRTLVFWLQVLHFVVSHVDVFISILRDRQTVHSSSSLQELGLVSGIVCNMGLTEVTLTADSELGQEQIQLRGPLARIQRLMIGLLPRYCSSDSWEKVIWHLRLTFLKDYFKSQVTWQLSQTWNLSAFWY